MARIDLPEPYLHLSGKLRKSDNVYFRTTNGQTFMCHAPRKRTTKLSQAEVESRYLFAEVNKQTTALLKDPESRKNLEIQWKSTGKRKHATLRNYVFSELYKKTVEELRNGK